MYPRQWLNARHSRRSMLRNLGLLAGAGLTLETGAFVASRALASMTTGRKASVPIKHILIASQEISFPGRSLF